MTVTALLVSHDGARWLPAVLDGLLAQTRAPDRTVVVDTGSQDATVDIVTSRLGAAVLHQAPSRTSYPEAVHLGLQAAPPVDGAGEGDEPEWLWLLHDDSRPDPEALAQLLRAAAENPSVSILGPKIREWPSLRRLLEVGVTLSGTGRRETGLERGEYDQGQHDRLREVLAVSSAGMLVRRDVFESLGGFDPQLPMFGNDVDLGWRAARAGHRTLVVPDAVVFHVEAAHRAVRRTPVTGNHRREERRAALYTLLVNGSRAALPFMLVRLVLGSLLRALGLLLVRAPREALDELVALAHTYLRPDRVLRGRRGRRRTSSLPPGEVRHLLAPFWLPYRHGLDFVSDLATAVVLQAADVSAARRTSRAAAETGPVPAEAEEMPADVGLLARLLGSPTALAMVLLVLLALVSARGVLGPGFLSGGALLPAPADAAAWWGLYVEDWHYGVGVGSDLPAAPYLLPLAMAGTVLLGKAWLVLDLLFLLGVPLAAWGAWRLLRRLTGRGWVTLWGAGAYAIFPVVTGAVNQGRLGTVAAAVVLPWLAHAALFLDPRHTGDRRWRAAWRTALLLALLSSFAPLAWVVAVVVATLCLVGSLVLAAPRRRGLTVWTPLVVAVAAVPVLLLPWSVLGAASAPGPWYAEAGLASAGDSADLGAWDLLTGRAGELGAAPGWITVGIGLAAVAALVRRDTRRTVLGAWVPLLIALATAVFLDSRGEWAGFPLLVAYGAAVTAAATAGTGVSTLLAGRSFGWRQPLGLLVVASAVLAPLAGLLWWVGSGVSAPLDRVPPHGLPAYMTDAALRDADNGILVVRDEGDGFGFNVVRGEGVRLGDDSVTASGEAADSLAALVGDLATAPTSEQIAELSGYGVEFVYLPPPADPVLSGNLDAVSGLTSASAVRPHARAWQLEAEPSRAALPAPDGSAHPVLLLVQAVALVGAAVLAAPTRKVRR